MEHNGPWAQYLIVELEKTLECPFSADDIDDLETEWQHEVANGDTIYGLKDWIISRTESEKL